MANNTQKIATMIKELGVPANLSGYYHLRFAIELLMGDVSLVNKISKVIYPSVAEHFKSTSYKVERCIRHAIQTGWNRGNKTLQNKLFGYTIDTNKGFPTNGEFIATVADYLVLLEQEEEA